MFCVEQFSSDLLVFSANSTTFVRFVILILFQSPLSQALCFSLSLARSLSLASLFHSDTFSLHLSFLFFLSFYLPYIPDHPLLKYTEHGSLRSFVILVPTWFVNRYNVTYKTLHLFVSNISIYVPFVYKKATRRLTEKKEEPTTFLRQFVSLVWSYRLFQLELNRLTATILMCNTLNTTLFSLNQSCSCCGVDHVICCNSYKVKLLVSSVCLFLDGDEFRKMSNIANTHSDEILFPRNQ